MRKEVIHMMYMLLDGGANPPIVPPVMGTPARATTDGRVRMLTDGTIRVLVLYNKARILTTGSQRVLTDGSFRYTT